LNAPKLPDYNFKQLSAGVLWIVVQKPHKEFRLPRTAQWSVCFLLHRNWFWRPTALHVGHTAAEYGCQSCIWKLKMAMCMHIITKLKLII